MAIEVARDECSYLFGLLPRHEAKTDDSARVSGYVLDESPVSGCNTADVEAGFHEPAPYEVRVPVVLDNTFRTDCTRKGGWRRICEGLQIVIGESLQSVVETVHNDAAALVRQRGRCLQKV